MVTIINRKDLADRWDTNVTTLDAWEREGVIKRLPRYPSPRYSLADVEKAESSGMDNLLKKKDGVIRDQGVRIQELEVKLENIRRMVG